jgi:hypothetical protein
MKRVDDIFRTAVLGRPALTEQQRATIATLRGLKQKLKISPQDDGTLKVKGTIELHHRDLDKMPDLSVVDLDGSYLAQANRFTSLDGAPRSVTETFNVCGNNITSLDGAPRSAGNFFVRGNQLTTLEGGPDSVHGDYDCGENKLVSLKGAPKRVDSFICTQNQLASLEHGPQDVAREYDCSDNKLKSLKGAPLLVKNFNCDDNKLASLAGGPDGAMQNYSCKKNPIRSFDGAPKVYLTFQYGNKKYNFPNLPNPPKHKKKSFGEPIVAVGAPVVVRKPIVFAKKGAAP